MDTRILYLGAVLLLIFFGGAQPLHAASQETSVEVFIDANGDGTLAVKIKQDAQSYMNWKQNIGDHPDLLVRNFQRQFSAQYLSDFAFEKDDLNRSATVKMKGRAFASLTRSGRYSLGELINARFISNSNNDWIFRNRQEGGPQQNTTESETHVHLPKEAIDAKVINPESDAPELTYDMPHLSPLSSPYLISAVVLGAIGVTMLFVGLILPKRRSNIEPPSLPPLPLRR
jgi:hypothetical protein